ncbi:MAG: DbpA RNA binding domain-containing protein, partial [Verrucomicrobia bacterium]|nr:DbpA RNA binding domain-containing protein [Verrucomicrobiota bacterium]
EQGHAATDIASALIHLLNQSGGEKPGRPAERKAEPRVPLSQKETAGADATGQARHAATPRARPENEVNSDRVSHEPGMVRLALDVGREHDIRAGDVVGVILGATRIPKECVGAIRMRDRETLVDVAEEHADTVLKKLHGIRFKGRKLTARLAG